MVGVVRWVGMVGGIGIVRGVGIVGGIGIVRGVGIVGAVGIVGEIKEWSKESNRIENAYAPWSGISFADLSHSRQFVQAHCARSIERDYKSRPTKR